MADLESNSWGRLKSDAHYGKRRPGQDACGIGEEVAAQSGLDLGCVSPQIWCEAHQSRAVKGWGNEAAEISIFSNEDLSNIKNKYLSSLLPPASVQFLALSASAGDEINHKGNDTAGLIRS